MPVSVVIPALDEEALLPRGLDALLPQAEAHRAEVLVVDGGSEDATREIAASRRGVRLVESSPGRAAQMNAGAREARGSLLLFLPADAVLPAGAIADLHAIDRAGEPEAGGFLQAFDDPRPFLRAISRMHNLRARLTGIVYGDQAPWVRRDLFEALSGYREGMDLEDLEFGVRVKRLLGRRPRLLPRTVLSSSRRFDRAGDLRATADAARILFWWTFLRRTVPSPRFFSRVR